MFESAKACLKSAINVLALTCLLDENEEPGDALSEIEAAHPRQ
ncbi:MULTISPECIES: hypothetical protein [Pseudomonas aeruginosa group]|nr:MULTISPECIES: hypothetical protein [Pseudomonas aeruginosa group]MDK2349880.1 hypothetical protein [Pseudomonas paraeruginosa]MDV7985171.1 hypothetical protein [Pseudomonas paraeruginosa]MDY1588664.1 hypothetical protein [Pseudomonas paraeruginosa]MEA8485268.1 hypothetical protein [Pseudomonas aeruginosa]